MLDWQLINDTCLSEAKRLEADIFCSQSQFSNLIELILPKQRFTILLKEEVVYWHLTNLMVEPWISESGKLNDINDLYFLIERFSHLK
jgi:hypothetical protein